jgi:ABC-2 type transport system permease protein
MVFSTLFLRGQADMKALFDPEMFSPFFSPMTLLIILAPAITMKLLAEEKRSGTIELISSMPIQNTEIVLGKFLAAVALCAVALGITLIYAVTISSIGTLDWGAVIKGYLGLLLFVSSLLAIGVMCSSWTNNQIVAFILSFFLSAILYYVHWLHILVPDWLSNILSFMSVSAHLNNMARGVIDSRDLLYYLTLIFGALFIAERSLGKQRA